MLEDVQKKCSEWFGPEYDTVIQEYVGLEQAIAGREKELEALKEQRKALEHTLEP